MPIFFSAFWLSGYAIAHVDYDTVFWLFQSAMPWLLTFLRRKMNAHLSYGFDVGRGYVAGEEEVRKLIDHMVDHKDIAKSLKQISDNGRLDVIRCLGKNMLGNVYIKSVFGVCKQHKCRPVCTSAQSNRSISFSLIGMYHIKTSYELNFIT